MVAKRRAERRAAAANGGNGHTGPILDVQGLKTQFQTQDGVVKAVDDVSFYVMPGETLGVVGESGCGKSMTGLSIMRLIPNPPGKIVAGEIVFDGDDIMTMSDNIRGVEFGPNAYYKPSAALTVLRESVMGPELFDAAFKEYAKRWAFKHPKPADFFRTMEDASAVDLDWFWRGWFFSNDNVDVAVSKVKWFRLKDRVEDPENKSVKAAAGDLAASDDERHLTHDFSRGPRELTLTDTPQQLYGEFRSKADDNTIRQKLQGKNIYEITFTNIGGLVTPLVIQWTYKDGSKETEKIPAEVWRINEQQITKVFIKDKEVIDLVLDPNFELADVDATNNTFPKKTESRFDRFKRKN